jgi:ATPase subunit of ABC transporter with duplicated ATPase domains
MLLTVDIESKSLGNKQLFNNLRFTVEANEKVAIIGRNGVGKTTLFRMLTNHDPSYNGTIQLNKGTRVISTAQEHTDVAGETVLDYIVGNLPDYARLKEILDTYPDTMGDNLAKIQTYSNALEEFSNLDYYTIEDAILQSLEKYQINSEMAHAPLGRLSGGQKRFVELVRIEHANADLALIDEPTNHMDYIAKTEFISWLKSVKYAVVVISHDRDVLQYVDKIIDIKDGKAHVFKGNYRAYLKQNATSTAAKMHDYEIGLRTLENLAKQIQSVRAKKASTGKTPNPFIPLERRLMKAHADLAANLKKPNFWIDQASVEDMGKKVGDNYEKYKTKNIRIHKAEGTEASHELLRVEDLQLGYNQKSLFKMLNFNMQHGERMQLIGRNGVGKTTLVRAIMDTAEGKRASTYIAGSIFCDKKLRLSVYDQEVDPALMDLTLHQAIERTYQQLEIPVTNEIIMRLMGDYLFNPHEDGRLLVHLLSGGQKARLQIIKLMANNPNMLILDEPTNHLDLPSIEELEKALNNYHGALLYVSHDSYFVQNIGGEKMTLQAA